MNEAQDINHDKLMELFGNVFSHISGAVGLLMSYLGDQTGLYSKIEEMGSCTAKSLSDATDMDERYLQEWLSANAAHGYITLKQKRRSFI